MNRKYISVYENIKAKSFSKNTDINVLVQEAQWTMNKMHWRKSHYAQNNQYKEMILKAARQKWQIAYRGTITWMTADLSSENMEAKNILKYWEEK